MDGQPHDIVIASFDSFYNQASTFLNGIASRLVEREEMFVIGTDLRLSEFVKENTRFFRIGKTVISLGDADPGEDLVILSRQLAEHRVGLFQGLGFHEEPLLPIDDGIGCEDDLIWIALDQTEGFSPGNLRGEGGWIALENDLCFIKFGADLLKGKGEKVEDFSSAR